MHVIDGRDLGAPNKGIVKPVLKLSVGDYSFKTQEVRPSNDPVWDEDFHFDIKTGTETLKVALFDGFTRVADSEIEISLDILSRDVEEID